MASNINNSSILNILESKYSYFLNDFYNDYANLFVKYPNIYYPELFNLEEQLNKVSHERDILDCQCNLMRNSTS